MDYTSFELYPLHILGIDESYNDELIAIETIAKSEIAYMGTASDIESVLPYFVFFMFCENRASEVHANAGEGTTIKEFLPSALAQVRAWNLGAKMLNDICIEKVQTANDHYRSQRESI